MSQLLSMIRNNRILIKNISETVLLKGVSFLLVFIMTPMYIDYFENQAVLGVWYTILSILTWILTFDLGIGNGLRNKLSHAIALNNTSEIKKLISSAYIILGVISFVIFVIGSILISFLNWNKILNVDIAVLPKNVLLKAVIIVFCGIILQFWLKIITSVFLAMQKNVLVNLIPVTTNILILIYLFTGKTGNLSEDLINLAFVNIMATLLPLIVATVFTFMFPLKKSIPRVKYYNKDYAVGILSLGGIFFIIQLGLLVVNSTNPFLITQLYQSEDVVTYQIYYRLFSVATMVFLLFTQPIWSATSNAYAKGDFRWIKRVMVFNYSVALIGSICCFLVILILQPVFNIWLGNSTIQANGTVALLFAVYISCDMFVSASTCIANGITKLKCQFICVIISALVKIPLAYILSLFYDNWVSVVVAHIISILPLLIIQPLVLRKQLNNLSANSNKSNAQ